MRKEETKNKSKWIFVLFYSFFFISISTAVLAGMLQSPTSIVVGRTNFSEDLKKDCALIQLAAYAEGYKPENWQDFVAYKHLNGTPVTESLETYVKKSLPAEWGASWDEKSLYAGSIAVRNFAWYKKNIDNKWNFNYNFDITDTACDQRYKPESQYPTTDNAVDFTKGYYAQENSTGSDVLLETRYTKGTQGDGTKNSLDAGKEMSQYGTKYWAEPNLNKPWEWIMKMIKQE